MIQPLRFIRGLVPGALFGLILAATLLNASVREQTASSPRHDVITIEGTVRNAPGEAIASASVFLDEKGSSVSVENKTNADGGFSLVAPHPGTYTLRAERARERVSVSLTLSRGEKKHVDLILAPSARETPSTRETTSAREHAASCSAASSSSSAAAAMQLQDEPKFTVAGITDWANTGTHGSDVRGRTGEALAKDTAALESRAPEGSASGASAKASEAEAHRLSGDRKERSGNPLGAVHEYEQAVRLDPSERNYFAWGTELLLHRALQPAVEVFTKGAREHPTSGRMLAGLGAALYASGSSEEAAHRLCDAADLNPADPTAHVFLGKIEKSATDPLPCAQVKLARFAREHPENALANYYYAVSLWKRSRNSRDSASIQQVKELLERAVTIDSRFAEGYLQLGIVHSARGEFEDALRSYKKAIELDPDLAEAHYRLGLAYRRAGEEAKSLQELGLYKKLDKNETAALEQQRRELRQFMTILKDQPSAAPPD